MKKIYLKELITVLLFTSFFWEIQGQELKPDGFLNTGGTIVSSEWTLTSSIGEPVIGLIMEGGWHNLQGFVYKTVVLDIKTGNEKPLVHTADLKLYPNPASDHLYLEFPGDFNQVKYSIFSLDNKLVKSGLLTGVTTRIDVSALNPASYLLSLELTKSQGFFNRKKFVIIK